MVVFALSGLWDCFLLHIRKVFSYYLFKYLLRPFLSLSSFWDLYKANVGAFDIVSGLKLPSFLLIFFSLFFYTVLTCTILSSSSPIHSSASFIQLFIPSRVFFTSIIVFFNFLAVLYIF